MTNQIIEHFKLLGSNSEAKKMFALEYFTRAMERFESGIQNTGKPDWAKDWVKRPAKTDGFCSTVGCLNQHESGDPVYIAFGESPRCLSCGPKY